MDFVIAIPSYRRAGMIEAKTLALLDRHGISRDCIHIFVANGNENNTYRDTLGEGWKHIVTGVPGLWRQRNFITAYFPEGTYIVSLDDDVEDILRLHGDPNRNRVRKPLHAGGLVDIINDARMKMEEYGINLWSLNTSSNVRDMGHTLTYSWGLCNGFFWGCLNRKSSDLRLLRGDGHEDFERTCRFWRPRR